ncbi:MAG: hypothetical protein U0992_07640 [Planctomycetaceae bacterium]
MPEAAIRAADTVGDRIDHGRLRPCRFAVRSDEAQDFVGINVANGQPGCLNDAHTSAPARPGRGLQRRTAAATARRRSCASVAVPIPRMTA